MTAAATLVAVATPLTSALIAGLIALLVVRRQKRGTQEAWVMDRRYELYGQLVDATHELIGSPDRRQRPARLQDPDLIARLTNLLHRFDLIAPDEVLVATTKVYALCWEPLVDIEAQDTLVRAINGVLVVLQGQLVPKHMR